MPDTEKDAPDAVSKLLDSEPDQLYTELAIRQQAMTRSVLRMHRV